LSYKPFDMGQFLSRQFNFVYVVVSIGFLLFTFSPQLQLSPLQRFWWIIGAFVLDLLVVQGFKHAFYAPRPHYEYVWKWGRHPHSGFPSGHSVPAFMLATMVHQAAPHIGPFWYVGATLIAFGRWKAEGHYAWQVTVSAFIGILLAVLAHSFIA
jgi:hypothetical protein